MRLGRLSVGLLASVILDSPMEPTLDSLKRILSPIIIGDVLTTPIAILYITKLNDKQCRVTIITESTEDLFFILRILEKPIEIRITPLC